MTPADRAIVAAAEERDRAWPRDYRNWPRDVHPAAVPSRDRRELLRIVREQEARIAALEKALKWLADDAEGMSGPVLAVVSTLTKLRSYVEARALLAGDGAEDAADDAAATEATAGKWR